MSTLYPFKNPVFKRAWDNRIKAMELLFETHQELYEAAGQMKDEWVGCHLDTIRNGGLPEPIEIVGSESISLMEVCRQYYTNSALIPVTPPGLVIIGGMHGLLFEAARTFEGVVGRLDALSSASSVFDHGYPKIFEAVVREHAMGANRCFPYHPSRTAILASEKLAHILPGDWMVSVNNDGGSANTSAIKRARAYAKRMGHPRRVKVVAFKNSYFGNQGSSALVTAFRVGSSHIYSLGEKENYIKVSRPRSRFEADSFIDMIRHMIIEDSLCLIMFEAVPGDGGMDPLSGDLLRQVIKLCWEENNIPVLYDEIQSFIRTGKTFAWQYMLDTPPPMISLGKMVTGGFSPASPLLYMRELEDSLIPPQDLSTYCASDPGMAAISVMVDIATDPNFLREVRRKGELLQNGFAEIAQEHRGTNLIVRPKGIGMFAGIEVRDELGGKSLASATALMLARMAILVGTVEEATVRTHLPPVATDNDIFFVIEAVKAVLRQFAEGEVDPFSIQKQSGRGGLDLVGDLVGS